MPIFVLKRKTVRVVFRQNTIIWMYNAYGLLLVLSRSRNLFNDAVSNSEHSIEPLEYTEEFCGKYLKEVVVE